MENDTRSKLIEIATPLFATKGFAAVSVRELTVAAQINVSAISYYFNGKEGLYQAVLAEQLAPILQALRRLRATISCRPSNGLPSMPTRSHAFMPGGLSWPGLCTARSSIPPNTAVLLSKTTSRKRIIS